MGYSKKEIRDLLKDIPIKLVKNDTIDGAIVLEGGAFRGVYQEGVLDCLMEHGYNFNTTIGVSAGALNGATYSTFLMGRSTHINIRYRHNGRYVGINAYLRSKFRSPIGFDIMFNDLPEIPSLDINSLKNNGRKYVVAVTNLLTGKAEYYDNTRDDLVKCIRASATLPYISKPVIIDDKPYMDGGVDDRIPFKWAMNNGIENIIVVRTRDKKFRCNNNFERKYKIAKRLYSSYPNFAYNLAKTDDVYNDVCDELEKLENEGKIFVFYPSEPLDVKMLEGDLNKLKTIYSLGYNDALNRLNDLDKYLSRNNG